MSTSVVLPALGESVTEGTVTRWLKQVGDDVTVDERLALGAAGEQPLNPGLDAAAQSRARRLVVEADDEARAGAVRRGGAAGAALRAGAAAAVVASIWPLVAWATARR